MKLRFSFRGLCTVEDLWDLPVEVLDAIFKSLNQHAKLQSEESLLGEKSQENEALALQISIVKHVVVTKLAETKAREDEILKAAKKQKLLAFVAEKQDESLRALPIEEIQELIKEL